MWNVNITNLIPNWTRVAPEIYEIQQYGAKPDVIGNTSYITIEDRQGHPQSLTAVLTEMGNLLGLDLDDDTDYMGNLAKIQEKIVETGAVEATRGQGVTTPHYRQNCEAIGRLLAVDPKNTVDATKALLAEKIKYYDLATYAENELQRTEVYVQQLEEVLNSFRSPGMLLDNRIMECVRSAIDLRLDLDRKFKELTELEKIEDHVLKLAEKLERPLLNHNVEEIFSLINTCVDEVMAKKINKRDE
jgi:hypothetical protein